MRLTSLTWPLLLFACVADHTEPADPELDGSLPQPDSRVDDFPPSDLAPSRCPEHMVFLSGPGGAFCIDQFESSTSRILAGGAEEPWPFDRPVDGLVVRAVVRPGQKPQAYISGTQAAAACQRADKRLCTEAEWLFACQGPAKRTYPYGNTYRTGACNEGRRTHPVNDCFGPGSSVFTYANMNHPCCVNLPNTVAVGGAFADCKTDPGVYDLHGNLHEWIDATTASGNGVFKGGFFVDAKLNGPGCLYKTTAHGKTYHDYSTGFRCCRVPL